jgi:phosphonate transport system substrate-binding protein
MTPLIKYLAQRLHEENITDGKVIIAKDAKIMAQFMNEGKADILIESVFPTLLVNFATDSKMLLRRWKDGIPQYSSVIISKKDVTDLEQLKGSKITFDHPYSTTGFFIPKTMFLEKGYKIVSYKNNPGNVSADLIKYIFSNSDENTFFWVLRGLVKAGAIDYPSYLRYSNNNPDTLNILYKSHLIPRHVVSFRKDLPQPLLDKIVNLLIHMHQNKEGLEILKAYQNTAKFDLLPDDCLQLMNSYKSTIKMYYREYLK